MPSNPGSPKKKLMDRLISGMSPGRRRVSSSQFNVQDNYAGDSDDSSSVISRRSSLRSIATTATDYRSAFEVPMQVELVRPTDLAELERMFARLLIESNLGNNERMLKMSCDDKWRLIQAHARAEQQSDSPMTIIDRMSSIAMQLESCKGAGVSGLKFLEKTVLDALKVSFRTASVSWLQTFVENGGCELMVQIMKHIQPERYCFPALFSPHRRIGILDRRLFGLLRLSRHFLIVPLASIASSTEKSS